MSKLNPFELKKLDGWAELKVTGEMSPRAHMEYSAGYQNICSSCVVKYGNYTGGVTTNKEEIKCDWCGVVKQCADPIYAGWPDMKTPKITPFKVV